MREVHAVIYRPREFSSLKRFALLFEKFHLMEIYDWYTPAQLATLPTSVRADFEFLQSRNVVAPITIPMFEKLDARPFDWEDTEKFLKFLGNAEKISGPHFANELISDNFVRNISAGFRETTNQETVPICKYPLPAYLAAPDSRDNLIDVLCVAVQALPVPDEKCAWVDIIDFRNEMQDKRWGFRRFLHSLATKKMSSTEVRDEIEWLTDQYSKAMKIHKIKASQSFVDVFVISPLEIIENLVKFDWSKIARGVLSIRKRKIELQEAEMKAPGRECAYVFDARIRFGDEELD
jgi:hypothetical protein